MDPFLGALILAWFLVKGSAEDAAFNLRGKPSPRQAYRQTHGPSGTRQIADAIGGRIAKRIAGGPAEPPPAEARPMGWKRAKRYAEDLFGDAKAARDAKMEDRRRRREGGTAGDDTEAPDPVGGGSGGETPEGDGDREGSGGGEERGRERRRRWYEWPEPERVWATAERMDRASEPESPERKALDEGPGAEPGSGPEPKSGPEATAHAGRERTGAPEPEPVGAGESAFAPGPEVRVPEAARASRNWDGAEVIDDGAGSGEQPLVVEGEVGVGDGAGQPVLLRHWRGREVPVAVTPQHCRECGARMVVQNDVELDERDGTGRVGLKCPKCGVETNLHWRLTDEEFEEIFGRPRRVPPACISEEGRAFGSAPDASTTSFPGQTSPGVSTGEGERSEMTSAQPAAAESGLGAYQAYVAGMIATGQEMVASLETTTTSMRADEFRGRTVEALEQIMSDVLPQMQALLEESAGGLQAAHNVADAYDANTDAGHRDALQDR